MTGPSKSCATAIPCPACGEGLDESAALLLQNWIPAASAPQGEPVLDLVLSCACGAAFNAFIVLSNFHRVPHD